MEIRPGIKTQDKHGSDYSSQTTSPTKTEDELVKLLGIVLLGKVRFNFSDKYKKISKFRYLWSAKFSTTSKRVVT